MIHHSNKFYIPGYRSFLEVVVANMTLPTFALMAFDTIAREERYIKEKQHQEEFLKKNEFLLYGKQLINEPSRKMSKTEMNGRRKGLKDEGTFTFETRFIKGSL